jgi:hypothetical protein
MLINHYARGKFYQVACPEGTRIVRGSESTAALNRSPARDLIVVPFGGKEIRIPVDLPDLLPLLAESGRCGLSLVGEPRPDAVLKGAVCPRCGQSDVNWLFIEDDSQRIHCDYCGADFDRTVSDRIVPAQDANQLEKRDL